MFEKHFRYLPKDIDSDEATVALTEVGRNSSAAGPAVSAKNTETKRKDPELRTKPKPDWVFAFPGYTNNGCRGYDGTFEDHGAFSIVNLAYLEAYGVFSSPLVSLLRGVDERRAFLWEPESGNDTIHDEAVPRPDNKLHCFPWAIVEIKHEGVDRSGIKKCYSQAANACSAALTMLESLGDYGADAPKENWTPPIISMTFIGPIVKVWLAYSQPNRDQLSPWATKQVTCAQAPTRNICLTGDKHMACIWEGNITHPVDAIQLLRIKDNALCWVLRELKPWIRHHLRIHYARLKACEDRIPKEKKARICVTKQISADPRIKYAFYMRTRLESAMKIQTSLLKTPTKREGLTAANRSRSDGAMSKTPRRTADLSPDDIERFWMAMESMTSIIGLDWTSPRSERAQSVSVLPRPEPKRTPFESPLARKNASTNRLNTRAVSEEPQSNSPGSPLSTSRSVGSKIPRSSSGIPFRGDGVATSTAQESRETRAAVEDPAASHRNRVSRPPEPSRSTSGLFRDRLHRDSA